MEINLSSCKYTGKGNAQNEIVTNLLQAQQEKESWLRSGQLTSLYFLWRELHSSAINGSYENVFELNIPFILVSVKQYGL